MKSTPTHCLFNLRRNVKSETSQPPRRFPFCCQKRHNIKISIDIVEITAIVRKIGRILRMNAKNVMADMTPSCGNLPRTGDRKIPDDWKRVVRQRVSTLRFGVEQITVAAIAAATLLAPV